MPFSRSAFLVGRLISVPSDATEQELDAKCLELQEMLNRLTAMAEAQASKSDVVSPL